MNRAIVSVSVLPSHRAGAAALAPAGVVADRWSPLPRGASRPGAAEPGTDDGRRRCARRWRASRRARPRWRAANAAVVGVEVVAVEDARSIATLGKRARARAWSSATTAWC